MTSLKRKAAIIGIADLKPTKKTEETSLELTARVIKRVLEDAKLDKDEVDGMLLASTGLLPYSVCEYLKMPLRYGDVVGLRGAAACGMVWRAAAVIEAGLCNTVLCVAAGAQGVQDTYDRKFSPEEIQFERPFGNTPPTSGYALIARRYMYEYGVTSEQMAKVAVDQRTNACANPDALFYGQPITIDDVLNSRMICSPLHLLDIVLPCSGGSAFIMTSAERAKKAAQPPVWLMGAGEYCSPHHTPAFARTLTTSAVKISAEKAFSMAGVTPQEIDLVEPYDCYTHVVLMTLEDAGFCKKGEGGKFAMGTDLTYKGQLPCNTHGGQLSFGQAGELGGGMTHVTEACRQLMGRAGARQVPNAKLAFVQGNGGMMSDEVSIILGV